VQLVIQAGAIGRDGEALVLDMGQPVRIDDVARILTAKSRRPVDIVYTGLRTGEKLHEDLLAFGEPDLRPVHPLISHVQVPPVGPVSALGLDPWAHQPAVVDSMWHLLALAKQANRDWQHATDHAAASAMGSTIVGSPTC
jgi:hypothetical protein